MIPYILVSCSQSYKAPQAICSYQEFLQHPELQKNFDAYVDPSLLNLKSAHKTITVSTSKKRGTLYVNQHVAMDFPINVGTPNGLQLAHGQYKIEDKKEVALAEDFGNIFTLKKGSSHGDCLRENASKDTKRPQNSVFRGLFVNKWLKINQSNYAFHSADPRHNPDKFDSYLGISPGTAETLYQEVTIGTPVTIIE